MDRFTLYKESSVLLIVDIQERLAQVMGVKDAVIANNLHLISQIILLRSSFPRIVSGNPFCSSFLFVKKTKWMPDYYMRT